MNLSTDKLVKLLQELDFYLDNEDVALLRSQKIDSLALSLLSKKDLIKAGFKHGPAAKLVHIGQQLKNKHFFSRGKLSYFFNTPPSQWSINNFEDWCSIRWPSSYTPSENKRENNRFFFETITHMSKDLHVTPEVLDAVTKSLVQKKVNTLLFKKFHFLYYVGHRLSLEVSSFHGSDQCYTNRVCLGLSE